MPLVEITLAQGRSPELLRALLREVHDAVVRAAQVPDESVRVVIREVPPSHWSAGGVTLEERQGRPAVPPSAPVPGPDWIGSTATDRTTL